MQTFLDQIIATDEELLIQSSEFVTMAMNAAIVYPVHNLKIGKVLTPGNKVRDPAIEILDVCKADPNVFHSKGCELAGAIAKVIQPVNFSKPAGMEKL